MYILHIIAHKYTHLLLCESNLPSYFAIVDHSILSPNSNQKCQNRITAEFTVYSTFIPVKIMDILVDISNQPSNRSIRKRLSDGTIKEYNCKRVRKTLQVTFQSEAEKLCFEQKMKKASALCSQTSAKPPSNSEFLDILLDNYLQTSVESSNTHTSRSCCHNNNDIPEAKSIFIKISKIVLSVRINYLLGPDIINLGAAKQTRKNLSRSILRSKY